MENVLKGHEHDLPLKMKESKETVEFVIWMLESYFLENIFDKTE